MLSYTCSASALGKIISVSFLVNITTIYPYNTASYLINSATVFEIMYDVIPCYLNINMHNKYCRAFFHHKHPLTVPTYCDLY